MTTIPPWARRFMSILVTAIAISGWLLWKAWHVPPASASTSPFTATANFHWGENEQKPQPTAQPSAQPTPVKYVYLNQGTPATVMSPIATPTPVCQPCIERWDRYRSAILNGFGKDEEDHRAYELPQIVPMAQR